MTWQDWRNGHDYDIRAARVATSGTVLETFAVSTGAQEQISPAVTHGPGDRWFVVWSGWTDSVSHRVANTQRIWGRQYPETSGLTGNGTPGLRANAGATLVHGTLVLRGGRPAVLLDAAGRRVAGLEPGANDIGRLAPGVYFLRSRGRRPARVIVSR